MVCLNVYKVDLSLQLKKLTYVHFVYRRFSIKCCAKCRSGIAANEMVMRARDYVYHVTCFTCCMCNKTLLPGDYFGMRDSVIYCREDYEGVMQGLSPGSGLQSTSPGVMGGPGLENIPYFPESKRTQKGRPRKRKLQPQDSGGYRQLGKCILCVQREFTYSMVTLYITQ